ncbi:MAG TPA: PAS domain-containing protein [Burkholderiales bacterium]|nr:PAS domain-containing protein [Burkholderiales bacterium]
MTHFFADPFAWLAAAAGLACAGSLGWMLRERRRARRMEEAILSRAPAVSGPAAPRTDRVTAALEELDARVAAAQRDVRQQADELAKAEAALHESEERLRLAVRGASDGLWEWNFRTRQAYFSSRAKAMLGYTDEELGNGVREWRALIHPDDLKAALGELEAHIAGRSARFEFEHRMRHKDGSWRWVQARAAVVRHASGKPERLVGLYADVTARKRVQQLMVDLADGLSGLHGEACFRALVRSFAEVLGVREAFVCECCDYPTSRVRMLARWKNGDFGRCVEFDLAGTACQDVIAGGQVLYQPQDAGVRWPLERTYERDSYLGLPCLDSQGRVIGHIACADPGPMPGDLPQQAILKIFAVRAGLELERRELERERRAVGMRTAQHVALH